VTDGQWQKTKIINNDIRDRYLGLVNCYNSKISPVKYYRQAHVSTFSKGTEIEWQGDFPIAEDENARVR